MKKKFIYIFLISFLFKPIWLFNLTSLDNEGDDLSYWLHSATLAYDYDLDYSKDYSSNGETFDSVTNAPSHAPGSGFAASPFVFIFKYIDIIKNNDFERNNPVHSYAYLGYFFSALIYCYFGFYFLNKIKSVRNFKYKNLIFACAYLSTLVHFVSTRFLMVHVFEFFLVSLMIYTFEELLKKQPFKAINLLILIYFLLAITRPSTFLCSILLALVYKDKIEISIKELSYSFINFILFSSLYFYLSQKIYNQNTILLNISNNNTTSEYVKNFNIDWIISGLVKLPNLFISSSMGLIWSTPIVFIGLLSIFNNKRTTYKKLTIYYELLYVLSFFMILIVWQGREVAYGQRLLIGLIPFLIVKASKNSNFTVLKIPTIILSFITYVGYLYFYSSSLLTLRPGKTLWGLDVKWSAEGYYINLLLNLLNPENIVSLLARNIYAVIVIKFANFREILNQVLQRVNFNNTSIERFENLIIIYEKIDILYIFLATFFILTFSKKLYELFNEPTLK